MRWKHAKTKTSIVFYYPCKPIINIPHSTFPYTYPFFLKSVILVKQDYNYGTEGVKINAKSNRGVVAYIANVGCCLNEYVIVSRSQGA